MQETIKQKLTPFILSEKIFLNELTLEIAKEHLLESLKTAFQEGYTVLMDLTGVDYLNQTPKTKVVYWLHNPVSLKRLRLFVFAAREEFIPSAIDIWPGAKWYERELYDLFGVQFEGHSPLARILMPDDWIGHPLRKDYPLTEEPVEFKHGVKPKVPSEIIPYIKTQIGNATHVKNT